MPLTVPDFIGYVGVAFVIVTYFLSQIGRMDATRPLYPLLNGVGAAMILYSLIFAFNAASVVVEGFWLLISAIGLVRALRRK